MIFTRAIICFVLILCLSVGAAWAQEVPEKNQAEDKKEEKTAEYVNATLDNLALMLVKFDTLDLENQAILDEVALLAYCEDYRKYYPNEFQWQKYREEMRTSLKDKEKTAAFPSKFYFTARVRLDRYNPKKKVFEFPGGAVLSFQKLNLSARQEANCGGKTAWLLPKNYIASLSPLFKMSNLPMTEAKGRKLVGLMLDKQTGNLEDRVVYLRFYVDIKDVLAFTEDKQQNKTSAELDAHISRLDILAGDKSPQVVQSYFFKESTMSIQEKLNGPPKPVPSSPSAPADATSQ